MTKEEAARLFHETYERLAPEYDYKTREASAVPWGDVPEHNRELMIATCAIVLDAFRADALVMLEALAKRYGAAYAQDDERKRVISVEYFADASRFRYRTGTFTVPGPELNRPETEALLGETTALPLGV